MTSTEIVDQETEENSRGGATFAATAAALAVAALALTGCSSGGGGASASSSSAAPTTASSASDTPSTPSSTSAPGSTGGAPPSTGGPKPTGPGAPPSGALGPAGYLQLRLGMTKAQALATGLLNGEGNDTGGCESFTVKGSANKGDSVAVYISPRTGLGFISAYSAGIRTPQGIGIGAPLKDVGATYVDLKVDDQGIGRATVPGQQGAKYEFTFQDGKLEGMNLYLDGHECAAK